jgi:membrane dipeptidase
METTSAVAEQFGTFDFGLTGEQEEQARRLHAESIVVDILFQGPCGARCYDHLTIPEPTGNAPEDYMTVNHAPIRGALAGDFDGFYRCWSESGITAGNRQCSFDGDFSPFGIAQAQFDRLPWLVKALTAADIRAAKAEGKHAGFITTQNTTGMDQKLKVLQTVYDLGMRMIGLTYNMQNEVGGGCTERTDTGVSNFGAKLIAKMDELGMIVDTAHSGRETTLDACKLSERQVVASHTSAEGVYKVDRAKSDEELLAIAETGGVIGVVTVPFFLAPGDGVTIEALLDHIDYISKLVGWQHVAIGTDWPLEADKKTLDQAFMTMIMEMGFRPEHNVTTENLVGFEDYRDFPNITRGLVARGYEDEQIRGILGENFLRVFEAVCG